MTHTDDIHAWFRESVPSFIAGALGAEERVRFEAHAAICAACEAALDAAKRADARLRALFADVTPAADFEDSILATLRDVPRQRRLIHPAVRRFGTGLAAAVVLAMVGYFGSQSLGQRGGASAFAGPGPLERMATWLAPHGNRYANSGLRDGMQAQAAKAARDSLSWAEGWIVADAGTSDTTEGGDAAMVQLASPIPMPVITKDAQAYLKRFDDQAAQKGLTDAKSAPPPAKPAAQAPAAPNEVAFGVVPDPQHYGYYRGDATPAPQQLGWQVTPPVSGGATDKNLWNFYATTGTDAAGVEGKPVATELRRGLVEARDGDVVMDNLGRQVHGTTSLGDQVTRFGRSEAALGTQGDVNGRGRAGEVNVGKALVMAGDAEAGASQDPGATGKDAKKLVEATASSGQSAGPTTSGTVVDAARKVIRTGTMEFEVDSFDTAFLLVSKIVAEESGIVASTDSERLANGKVKGTVTLRCPPEHLDALVLKLRALGDLKSQRIVAQDVTKQYTDFESQLKAARAMEERLLEIIKTGKGEVKDLVEAEKQLGVYREKIEQVEGELRYLGSQVALSTLTVSLTERDIRTPFAAVEAEQVSAAIEAEDVERARADALKAIDDAKGRVVESNLKQLDGGRLEATIVAEVAPDAAGAVSDRFHALGRVQRWEAQRQQTAQGGTGQPADVRPTAKLERRSTRFSLAIHNLANVPPREVATMTVAVSDVEAAYKAILKAVNDAGSNDGNKGAPGGRVLNSQLNAQKSEQSNASITLEVRTEQVAAVEAAIRSAGTVVRVAVTENPDPNNYTTSKRGYAVSLISTDRLAPREQQTLDVRAKDVQAAYQKLMTFLRTAGSDGKSAAARILASGLNEQDRENVTGTADFEVPAASVPAVMGILRNGKDVDVTGSDVKQSTDVENTLADKVRLTVTVRSADKLEARETTKLAVEAADVEKAVASALTAAGPDARVIDRTLAKQQNGATTAHVRIDVPLAAAAGTLDQLRALGNVRAVESEKNPQVTDGPLARARFDLTIGNAQTLVGADEGVWPAVRSGLRTALNGLLFSVQLLVVGLVLIGPFALTAWVVWKLLRRGRRVKA